LDELKEEIDIPSPPIAVLPLGTGNDLARTLGWGGGYTDEPIEKIIRHVEEGPVVSMDRWSLEIKRNSAIPGFQYEQAMGCETAPLHVINNYFSIGADAAITLNFHESREANPAKFNNRLKNKMFYVNASGKDLWLRKFSDLCSYIRFFIDGVEITEKLRTLRFEVLLVLNIFNYAAGATPWGTPPQQPQELSDNLAEILGLWSKTFPKLHLGGHGERLGQAKEVKIITSRSLPIQIDGEACMLKPSVITIKLKNQVPMIQKVRHHRSNRESSPNYSPFCTHDEVIKLSVETLVFEDYNRYKEDLYRANKHAKHLGLINLKASGTLSTVRKTISERFGKEPKLLRNPWCFLDVAHHGKRDTLYRVELEEEENMSVADMSCDGILVLELPEDSSSEEDLAVGIP
jgi:diacylglycerol kinase (ATP)